MWFEGWDSIEKTLLVGAATYVAAVVVLRVSGKRTLSKWNAFDLVVTVALGSTLATALLSKSTTFAQAAAAFALLAVLQLAVTWLSVRVRWFERFVKARPVYLVRDGRLRESALKQERVTHAEIRAALRGQGIARFEDVAAVVLETDGSFSILKTQPEDGASTLVDVQQR